VIGGRDDAFLRALVPDVPREGPRVDALDPDDAALPQISLQGLRRSPIAGHDAPLLDDEAFDEGAPGLHVLGVHPGVTEERIGHGHDLPLVGRIG